MRFGVLAIVLCACGTELTEEFGFVGEVADHDQNASTVGLFVVSSASPVYFYKLGDGTTVANQFDLSFETEPPPDAINSDGIGVALIGLLPGLATIPDGVVEQQPLLIGLSINHAVIFKTPGATGPAWSQQFPVGFSCARCVREAVALDTFEPAPCELVVVQALLFDDRCAWY